MVARLSADFLRILRNDIPVETVISEVLDIPNKRSEGYYRFLCPICIEFNTATNPHTNLARCFRCQKNFNTIDIVMLSKGSKFIDAVELLTLVLFAKEKKYRDKSLFGLQV